MNQQNMGFLAQEAIANGKYYLNVFMQVIFQYQEYFGTLNMDAGEKEDLKQGIFKIVAPRFTIEDKSVQDKFLREGERSNVDFIYKVIESIKPFLSFHIRLVPIFSIHFSHLKKFAKL